MTDEPLTEDDLTEIEQASRELLAHVRSGGSATIRPEKYASDALRLVADVRRLRTLIDRVANDACEYDDRDDECCFCGGEDGPNPEPHHHAKDCTLLAVQRETRCPHGMDRRAASTGACRECREKRHTP